MKTYSVSKIIEQEKGEYNIQQKEITQKGRGHDVKQFNKASLLFANFQYLIYQ